MLRTLVNELCNPVVIFIFFLITAKVYYFSGKEQRALTLFTLGVVWLLVVMSTPLSQYLIYNLENDYLPFEVTQQQYDEPVYVLVLNGGGAYKAAQESNNQLPVYASARLTEGLRIHMNLAGSSLITSGNAFHIISNLPNQDLVKPLELNIDVFGVPGRKPVNTDAEIDAYQKQIGDTGQLILVTSAMHMSRAMLICKKKGIQAIAAPSDYFFDSNDAESRVDFRPSPQKMEMMQRALHEYLGLLEVYFLK